MIDTTRSNSEEQLSIENYVVREIERILGCPLERNAFPEDFFRKKVEEYTDLMNRWFLIPHWGYDFENLCFIEISHSREYCSDFDKSDEIKPDSIIRVVD